MDRVEEIIADLRAEIVRQDEKHGRFVGSPLGRSRLALACLEDEVHEAHRSWRAERTSEGWPLTRLEVLQAAAVAVRALRDTMTP